MPVLVVTALLFANPGWSDYGPPAPETASEGQNTTQTPPAPQPIEEALGEAFDDTGSPLDAVAVDIENAEYAKAEAFLTPYLRAVEGARHRYHPDLVRPLLLLGDAQFGQGDFPGALDSYSQAVQVSRVSDGLFTPNQIEAVYKQSEALQRLGDGEAATRREEYAYEVLARAYGTEDEAMLPGVFRLARWYKDAYNIFAARALYQQALKIYGANGKAGTPRAIPALQGLAETYRMERFPPFYVDGRESPSLLASRPGGRFANYDVPLQINSFPVAERALQEVIRIRQKDAGTGPTPVSEAILDLADWHLMWEHFRKAHTLYEHVYERFEKVGSVDATSYFAEPVLLHFAAPEDPRPPPAGEREEQTAGFVEVQFQVSANGSVRNMEVVASEPDGLMDFPVRRSLRSARYRPAMVDGKATPFEGEIYRHEFNYFPRSEKADEDEDKDKDEDEDEKSA
ncbi:MAG: TonB family protein [Gammaproteobacteria bacterium]|nr:TonB family protein [Gammaproteobacteria bacterium]